MSSISFSEIMLIVDWRHNHAVHIFRGLLCLIGFLTLHKYSPAVYTRAYELFVALPLAAVVADQFFCIHGDISVNIMTVEDIQNADGFRELRHVRCVGGPI